MRLETWERQYKNYRYPDYNRLALFTDAIKETQQREPSGKLCIWND